MPVRSGQRNTKLVVQQATTTRDAHGGFVETYADDREVWAKVKKLTGRALFEAQQSKPNATHTVTIPWQTRINESTRFLIKSDLDRALHVEDVDNPDERRIELVCLCTEVSASEESP